ncbi:MAG: DUF4159 domain-containing protein [Verrucomicrobiae bacterium]|nr:DUF4159 domain-containing protein [Verrucomicrobiae bacterium]
MLTEEDLFDRSIRARLKRFAKRIINTQYFFAAVFLHIIFLAIWGGQVIFEKIEAKGLFASDSEVFVAGPPGGAPPPPPPPSQEVQQKETDVKNTVSAARAPERAMTRIATSKVNPNFSVPETALPQIVTDVDIKSDGAIQEKIARAETARLMGVRAFHQGGIQGAGGKRGTTGKGRSTVAKFTCYVGKYEGGDWDCNFGFVADNRWYQNCINNLMTQIGRWTKGNVKADLRPESLQISSREWIEKVKPPFIFITGHQDFVLNEAEVQNLREYLMLGGLLWIDSSLPGRRSRFDLAIRREMKKVLPDRDFEPVGNNHPVYSSYYMFTGGPPVSMNFYREPCEVIKVGAGEGDVAVFYTINDYSDLWETALTDKDKIDVETDFSHQRNQWIGRWGPHWRRYTWNWEDEFYYRNITEKTIHESYKFGINIVIYLLTRFQDKFMSLPGGSL